MNERFEDNYKRAPQGVVVPLGCEHVNGVRFFLLALFFCFVSTRSLYLSVSEEHHLHHHLILDLLHLLFLLRIVRMSNAD
jgi:hypothetical protein